MEALSRVTRPVIGIPAGRLVLRVMWVAVRLVMVSYFGGRGAQFFYQGY